MSFCKICQATDDALATGFPDDITEPDLLRSYAHAMLAATDEMEKMNGAIKPD